MYREPKEPRKLVATVCGLKSEAKMHKIVFVAQYFASALQTNGGDSRIEHLTNALNYDV